MECSGGLSDRLVEKLLRQALGGDDAPCHFTLDFKDCRSSQGLRCVGMALRNNKTISALTVRFEGIEEGRGLGSDREDIAGFCHFLAHNPSLTAVNVLSARMTPTAPAPTNTNWNAILCWMLEAVSKNDKVEKICVKGWSCKHVDEIASTSLKELKVLGWKENHLPESWPSLPIKTLKLAPHAPHHSLDRHFMKALSRILDTYLVPANGGICSIKHLVLSGWSFNLSRFLRSDVTRVETLHFQGIDFSHDEKTGCSKMDGLLLGLCRSNTTTSLCFHVCTFDLLACEKLKEEIQRNQISVKHLQLKGCRGGAGSYYGIDALFWSCTNLSGLGLDGDVKKFRAETLTGLQAGLDRGTLSSVMIPRSVKLTSIGASLTSACTTGGLTHLDLPFGITSSADVDFLVNLLENEQCQLTHFALNCRGCFTPAIVNALKKQRALDSLCLFGSGGDKSGAIFEALGSGLSQIDSLTSLALSVSGFLSPSNEEALMTAIAGNWSLERVSVHSCDEFCLPLLSVGADKMTKKLMSRNKAKKRINAIVAAYPNLSEEQKNQIVDCMKIFAELPDEGVPLNFWVLREQFIDTFF